jgi:glycerol-3-phosphate acyltransferase PlsY
MLQTLSLMLFGYLLGAIPFSFLIAKAHRVDLRRVGSGNTGASNVWRVVGFRAFVVALVLDVFKGWLPTFLAQNAFNRSPLVTVAVGLSAVLGHIFPIFIGFKGGKAVATTSGVILGFAPVLVLASAIVWTIVYKLSGYPSVSSMVDIVVIALLGSAMAIWGRLELPYVAFLWLAIVYIFYLHRVNIQRLLSGQEMGIGPKRRIH